jgi:hypothetical protein
MEGYDEFKIKYDELKNNLEKFINLSRDHKYYDKEKLQKDYNYRVGIVATQMKQIPDNTYVPPHPFRTALRYICGDVLQMLENYNKSPSLMISTISSVAKSVTPDFMSSQYSRKIEARLFGYDVQEFGLINTLLNQINDELKQKNDELKQKNVNTAEKPITGGSRKRRNKSIKGKRRTINKFRKVKRRIRHKSYKKA